MEYIIGFVIGCVLTGIITTVIFCIRHPKLGVLEVDETNPEDVKWRFVITKPIDFSKTKQIYLEVDSHADLSQE